MTPRESEIRTPSAKTAPLIVIDFSTLDHLGGGGTIALLREPVPRTLASLDADFLVLGSGRVPVLELRELVAVRSVGVMRDLSTVVVAHSPGLSC